MSGAAILLWELLGTAVMVVLGSGVVANVVLGRTYGGGSGWVTITLGWGFGVFAGASIADPSGGHVNPAVTLGLSLIHISEPTRLYPKSRIPSSA